MRGILLNVLFIIIIVSCNSDNDENQQCGIFEGDIVFSNQIEINEFGLCNYTEITGRLSFVEGLNEPSPIIDLKPLNSLTIIGGNLNIFNTALLTNLEGLGNLSFKDNLLSIYGNRSLENLDGLKNLQPNSIDIWKNPVLQNLDALSFESDTLVGVFIRDCPLLTNLNFLSNITTVRNALHIEGNHGLTELFGLHNIKSIGSYSSACCGPLEIINNNNLTSLSQLNNLEFILGGNIRITNNTVLNNFCGLQTLFASDGHLYRSYYVANNAFNPSAIQILSGYCSQ